MNRGRHRKKKIIQKIAVEDLINRINSIKNDYTFYNPRNSTPHWFNPYFSINEQRKT